MEVTYVSLMLFQLFYTPCLVIAEWRQFELQPLKVDRVDDGQRDH